MWQFLLCLIISLFWLWQPVDAFCNRIPHTSASKSPVDENYVLGIEGNPKTYIPGQQYTVLLSAYNGHSFISFMLGLESETMDLSDMNSLGYFELIDLTETRFSPRCANLVENTNTNVKTQINVSWIAPSSGSGCVYLRTTVVQHRDVWYKDDGFLTKQMCEEEIDDIENQPTIVDPCCACDEAKYELTFEGKWSRHTHPKDFPANNWRTRFSDIIGASHTVDYRFWQYGAFASMGLREVAEHGSTKTLESELKEQSDEIRTIIKARGIAFPNVTGKTFAVFRVDSRHHLISLVSMVQPSPDWIIGVSGLELCLSNCTWIDHKELNLYPWDAGTDSGPSYMSADQPQVPPDVIRRIKSNFPNDPRSPFYDPEGTPMKPLATLHINRRRLYEKTCESNEDEDNENFDCSTYPWNEWSECSSKCGPGRQYRERDYRNSKLAENAQCRKKLREEQRCIGEQCDEAISNGDTEEGENEDGSPQRSPECAISEWSEWSSCSATCGAGNIIRSRHYLNPRAKKKCQRVSRVRLQETRQCNGIDCGGEIGNGIQEDEVEDENGDSKETENYEARRSERGFQSYSLTRDEYIPPDCGVSPWSDFSPCLGPCGGIGKRKRIRQVWRLDEIYNVQKNADDPCVHIKRLETVNCTTMDCNQMVPSLCFEEIVNSPCRGLQISNFWYYDHLTDQCAIFFTDKCDRNRNKFKSKEICEETCQLPRLRQQQNHPRLKDGEIFPVIDCLVSRWYDYGCNVTCGEGVNMRVRKVLRSASNGGRPCPKHMVQYERCYMHCDGRNTQSSNYDNGNGNVQNSICRYSSWSPWTPCTLSCGHNSMRQRTRVLLNSEMAHKCKDRVEVVRCPIKACQANDND